MLVRARLHSPSYGLCLALVALAACVDRSTGPSIGGIEVVQGTPAMGVPGWRIRTPIVVRVTDAAGRPRSGVLVNWAVTLGGGSVIPLRKTSDPGMAGTTWDTTNAAGLAMAVWTLGPRAGPNQVVARVSDELAVTLSTDGEAFRADQVAGTFDHGCGLSGGEIWCWGQGTWTRTEATSTHQSPPFGWRPNGAPGRVDGPGGFTAVAVSPDPSVCALDAAGGVWCASAFEPTLAKRADLPPLRRLVGAAFGWGRYCGLAIADSTAWCWRPSPSEAAAAVPGSPAFVDLDIDGNEGINSRFFACGTLADSTAACWGTGPPGNGSATGSPIPVPVSGGHRFAEVAVGEQFACGRTTPGEVWCWGVNHGGALGTPGPAALVPVLAATGTTRITASIDIVLALKLGSLIRWGGGGWLTPGPVASMAGLPIADLAATSAECVALIDGQVYCIEEMWDASSVWQVDRYAPVHPVVVGEP